jgi:hypothetical protein
MEKERDLAIGVVHILQAHSAHRAVTWGQGRAAGEIGLESISEGRTGGGRKGQIGVV